MKKYFGTDGIRGEVNKGSITGEMFFRFGLAAGTYFSNQNKQRHKAIIAKDTRLSGYMLEPALVSGLISAGMDVLLLGPLPTNGLAMLTKSMKADLGIMLTASHNPHTDNGLKLFGPDGMKLSDKVEKQIEKLIDDKVEKYLVKPNLLGRAKRLEDATENYIEILKNIFPKSFNLSGMKIFLDCANGASYKSAPALLRELGAEVVAIGINPDGFNINKNCGSTHPELIQQSVKTHKADIGIAFDGDADRVIICDENGKELPTGSEGTIWFESDVEFTYHNDSKKTLESKHPLNPKWSTLGDIGRLDKDNFLYLTDRKAFMIISGGINIYPQEAENLIITHPKVYDCAVIGVPNEEFGEEVKAIVQPVNWKDTGPDFELEIINFCKENLSSIKCPRTVDFERELPRHPTGKLYKRLLKDRYWGKKDSKIV